MSEQNEYEEMVERYKVKRTTDDCFTPENVYKAMVDWASEQYGFSKDSIVRPFFPGGDYERFEYPEGCVVLDNPPFSILSRIVKTYSRRGIRFFMFAPTLTCFNAGRDLCNYVITDATLTYHNGARIRTSFVTNMGEYAIFTDPELDVMLNMCEEANTRKKVRKLCGIDYPPAVATAATVSAAVRRGVSYRVKKGEAMYISHVGGEKESIFGGGMLLSENASEEVSKAVAMKPTRRQVVLSEKEINLQKMMVETEGRKSFVGTKEPQLELFRTDHDDHAKK